MKNIKITEENCKQRLDKFLAGELKELSRSHIQKLIKLNIILVNKEEVNPHYKLKEDDEITIMSEEIPAEKEEKEKVLSFDMSQIPIIDETKNYIIINKPAGLIVHGSDHIKKETLVDVILKKFPELSKVGEDPFRPAIVHRLDKEVSGLMVLPKHMDSFDNLKNQFQKRTIKKEYTALVYGQTTKDQDEINFPITRSSQGYKMAALPESVNGEPNEEGKRAISNFTVIKKFINYTLLSVKIKTGRTHQIRCHLSAYGHPVVGDDLYSTKRTREKNAKLKLGRVFLVANRLEFTDLDGEVKKYELDLPNNLQQVLTKIK